VRSHAFVDAARPGPQLLASKPHNDLFAHVQAALTASNMHGCRILAALLASAIHQSLRLDAQGLGEPLVRQVWFLWHFPLEARNDCCEQIVAYEVLARDWRAGCSFRGVVVNKLVKHLVHFLAEHRRECADEMQLARNGWHRNQFIF
jgi:hypothetical protein